MSRSKEFDQDAAVELAMQQFWAHGYARTSMQDLLDTMGINRGSLYDTFGDKRRLFILSLRHYQQVMAMRSREELGSHASTKSALSNYFRMLVQLKGGCFITNSAIELSLHDQEISEIVRDCMRQTEIVIADRIKEGQAKGEISKTKNADVLARTFNNLIQGMMVMARVEQSEKHLDEVVRSCMQLLK